MEYTEFRDHCYNAGTWFRLVLFPEIETLEMFEFEPLDGSPKRIDFVFRSFLSRSEFVYKLSVRHYEPDWLDTTRIPKQLWQMLWLSRTQPGCVETLQKINASLKKLPPKILHGL